MSSDPVHDHALSELAAMVAVHIERAPGPLEKRLVLMHGFAQAQRLNPAVTDDPISTSLTRSSGSRVGWRKNFWLFWKDGGPA